MIRYNHIYYMKDYKCKKKYDIESGRDKSPFMQYWRDWQSSRTLWLLSKFFLISPLDRIYGIGQEIAYLANDPDSLQSIQLKIIHQLSKWVERERERERDWEKCKKETYQKELEKNIKKSFSVRVRYRERKKERKK